ncbi:hypothetical protein ABNF65_19345 [Paenibacillus larvae]
MSTYNDSFKKMDKMIQKLGVSKNCQRWSPPTHSSFMQYNSMVARLEEIQSRFSRVLLTPSKAWAELASRLNNLRELKAFQEPIPEEIVPEYENLSSAVERSEILIENVNVTVNINVVKEEKPQSKVTWYAAISLIASVVSALVGGYAAVQNDKTDIIQRQEHIEVIDRLDRLIDVIEPRFPKIKAE